MINHWVGKNLKATARAMNIRGRSTMTADQLRIAVRQKIADAEKTLSQKGS